MALVMYDLDGTLIDTADEIAMAVNATLSQYGHDTVCEAQVTSWIGHGTVWLMQQAWPHKSDIENAGTWKAVMENFMKHYKCVVGTISKPYPTVIETLSKLKLQGIKQAVVTNKEQPYTSKILAQHNMHVFFDVVVAGNTLPFKKPNPAVIAYCLEALNESKQNSLFVGDSETDLATAKNAGVIFWAVPYGYNSGRDIGLAKPDKLIDTLAEVPHFFKT
jgi:phosphoglycolate phosphatase